MTTLSDKTIKDIINQYQKDVPIKGYSIMLNGKPFVTEKGKSLWRSKQNAMAAFANALKYQVEDIVRKDLINQGINVYYWKHPTYIDAWKDFKQYLFDNNLIEIIELK